MDRRILTVDWVSRLFSIVGLLGALGIALYLYNESQKATPDVAANAIQEQVTAALEAQQEQIVAQVSSAVASKYDAQFAELESKRREADLQARSELDKDIGFALNAFATDAQDRLDKWELETKDSLDDRERAFNEHIASLSANAKIADNNSGRDSDNDAEITRDPDETESGSELRVARLALRPSSARAAADGEILVHNTGKSTAAISSIEFTPEESYDAKEPNADRSAKYDRERVVFSPFDNRATKEDQHSAYIHDLKKPVLIPAGEIISLRVEIDNAIHLNYGFIGELKIIYEDDKTLTVPNARVRFIDETEGSA